MDNQADYSQIGQNNAILGVVIHDLSTPLTVVEMMSRILDPMRDFAVEDRVKAHRKVLLALTNIRDIIKKVKLLEELRLGKRTLSLESVDPTETLKELKTMLEDRLKEKSLELSISSHLPLGLKIKADRTLLLSCVIGNVVTNAIKFSPKNRIIEVDLLQYDEKYVLIHVRDYGIGIPKDMIQNLFDFSKKTNRPGTDNETGSGLGLPLAKFCTSLMGGDIYVESYLYEKGISGSGTSVSMKFEIA